MYAENKGIKIWYEIHGKGDPTLIMVPGFQIMHSEGFKRNYVPHLSRHMRIVTLDLRGNGKSDRPAEGYGLENYVGDVHAVVEAAGLDRFALAGHFLDNSICIKAGRLTESCFNDINRFFNEIVRVFLADLNHGTGLEYPHFLDNLQNDIG